MVETRITRPLLQYPQLRTKEDVLNKWGELIRTAYENDQRLLSIIQTATVSSATAGGSSWTLVEVSLGATPIYDFTYSLNDATISTVSKVVMVPSGVTATGGAPDDWAWDGATIACAPATASAKCYMCFTPGPVTGNRKFLYQVT